MASAHDGKCYDKSPLNAGPSAASSTHPFLRSLPVVNAIKTEVADAQPPKGSTLDLPDPPTLQTLLSHSLNVLLSRLTKLEVETVSIFTTVAAKLISGAGRVKYRRTDFQNTTDTRFETEETEIGELSDDHVTLTSQVVQIEADLAQVHVTLDV